MDMANLMLWTFQCSNMREGTFWYSLKSRPLNSQLLKMSSSLHKSHLHSLPDTHQTPGARTVWTLHWTHVHSNLTLSLTRAVGNIVKDGTEGQHLLCSLLQHTTLFNIFFSSFYILKWLNVKKAVPKYSVFTSAMLIKDEQGNPRKRRHSCICLKYM